MTPLRLTDSQLRRRHGRREALAAAAAPETFLRAVADRLRDRADPGDGDVDRALRAVLELMESERARWLSP